MEIKFATVSEERAWDAILSGETVDSNIHCRMNADIRKSDMSVWQDKQRTLTPSFLSQILAVKTLRDQVTLTGLRFRGVNISADFEAENLKVPFGIIFDGCRFAGHFSMKYTSFETSVHFIDCLFEDGFDAAGTRVTGHFFLNRCILKGSSPTNLDIMEVSGSLYIRGSSFHAGLSLRRTSVKGALFAQNVTCDMPLDAQGASFSYGAYFTESKLSDGLRADQLDVGGMLLLDKTEVSGKRIDLSGAKVGHTLICVGSSFHAGMLAPGISIGRHMLLGKSNIGGQDLNISSSQVGGNLNLDEICLKCKAILSFVNIGGSLSLNRATLYSEIDLSGMKIEGRLTCFEATIYNSLSLDSISIKGHAHFDSSLIGRNLDDARSPSNFKFGLASANIGGILSFRNTSIYCDLEANNISVANHFLFNFARDFAHMSILYGRIGGNLNFSNAKLVKVNIAGSKVGGDLRFGSEVDGPPSWATSAELILRNVHASAFQDLISSWPSDIRIDLYGFSYNQLGGVASGGSNQALLRPTSWFREWLDKDKNYSRLPYQQLASVFRSSGYADKSDEILFMSRDRERRELFLRGRPFSSFLLFLMQVTIAYGLTSRFPLRVLCWAAMLVMLGTAVISADQTAAQRRHCWTNPGTKINSTT